MKAKNRNDLRIRVSILVLSFLACVPYCFAKQAPAGSFPTVQKNAAADSLSDAMIHSIDKTYRNIAKKITSGSLRYLKRLEKKEARIISRIARKDSAAAVKLKHESAERYAALRKQAVTPDSLPASQLNNYNAVTDTLHTALQMLGKMPVANDKLLKITAASKSINTVRSRLNAATDIKKRIDEGTQALKQQAEKLGVVKELRAFKAEAYYYQAQVSEYKALLKDPKKMEEKALAILRNSQVFKDFMSKNSLLSQLFPVQGGNGTAAALQGLQTRSAVQQQLNATMAGAGGGAQQYLQQQVQAAQSQMNALKDKLNKLSNGNDDPGMPDFKPNSQRTKSFLKRLEYGLNIQSQRTNALLPVTSDLALTAGYRLNDKSVAGIGAGYKIGWGKNIRNIKITSQGLSLRSYLDVKLKGSIWISGGYEYNYQQEFEKLDQLKDLDAWQKSGLIGLSKKYKIGKKNGNMQLLWDFLSYGQVPRTTALKFRMGYTF